MFVPPTALSEWHAQFVSKRARRIQETACEMCYRKQTKTHLPPGSWVPSTVFVPAQTDTLSLGPVLPLCATVTSPNHAGPQIWMENRLDITARRIDPRQVANRAAHNTSIRLVRDFALTFLTLSLCVRLVWAHSMPTFSSDPINIRR